MELIEKNVFPIINLKDLHSRYRFVRILGLKPTQSEYYQNLQQLMKLSYTLKEPVTVVERGREPYLVVPANVTALPASYNLVRLVAHLQPLEETFDLDYTVRNPETDDICLRFLRFYIQNPFYNDPRFWQPSAGHPFFERGASRTHWGVQKHLGFIARPMILNDGGIGFCVDATSCYVGANPLPVRLGRDEFNRSYKDRNFIYHYGDQWHQVRLTDFGDLDVSHYQILVDGAKYTLLDFIIRQARKPIAAELANLPDDASVVLYRNNRRMERSAPAALCYPVIDTKVTGAKEHHGETLLAPHMRRDLILGFVRKYMSNLSFGRSSLKVGLDPVKVEARVFPVPDFVFGNGVVLSAHGTPGAKSTTVEGLGKARRDTLRDRSAGFYVSSPLDRQYFFMPRSVHDSCGDQFLKDLCAQVDGLFPQPDGYRPVLVPYDDAGKKIFVAQALAIRKAVEANSGRSGYGVVMIHRTSDRLPRQEDQLAAMVARELYEQFDIRVGVIHSEMARRCYREVQLPDGSRRYEPDRSQSSKLSGYLRNVALNQVLLTNHRWPFVLGSRLRADVTIGIDVKHNTCGLLVVNENATRVRFDAKTSRQKEKLLDHQMATYLAEALRDEARNKSNLIETIVIHRDGRTWSSEMAGIERAIDLLKREGTISPNASVSVLEVSKTSPAPLRLFDVKTHGTRSFIDNPKIGTFHTTGEREGYLCATGREFPRKGTVHPLHVRLVYGAIPFVECLEDLYRLTTLAWTRPEDCTRYPITIKLNDRFLFEEAGQYDSQALDYAETLGQEA